jgi:exopolysaccharide biosynthesis polyprenyl glycosylphosphotransferase
VALLRAVRSMSMAARSEAFAPTTLRDTLAALDERTLELIEQRRRAAAPHRRGWLVRRMLLLGDTAGLTAAFVAAAALTGGGVTSQLLPFLATLPAWVVLAKLHGLYDRDEEHADYSTTDDFVGVFQTVTAGVWIFALAGRFDGLDGPGLGELGAFWALAVLLVPAARGLARERCRASVLYLQNAIIVGAGDVGQLIARKLLQHPEYGINVIGFVDAEPRERRAGLEHLALLGTPEALPDLVSLLDVERIVVSFSNEDERRIVEIVRSIKDRDVQIDLVPRLFDLVGPKVGIHTIEALPLVGLRPVRLSPSSRLLKRSLDVVVSALALVATAPLLAFIAWRIRSDSPGPVLFRQTRLGLNQREFSVLKFRTMKVDTDDALHRDYIKRTMSASAEVEAHGLYKLDRGDAITRVGRWLRKTSLDELPQLINVLRGEMSLVGPRPCIPYETENFAPHHYERFHVPAGVTGLWQVAARASSTFGEALDMDVAYARGWSLGLDLRLIARTPFALLRQRKATA